MKVFPVRSSVRSSWLHQSGGWVRWIVCYQLHHTIIIFFKAEAGHPATARGMAVGELRLRGLVALGMEVADALMKNRVKGKIDAACR